MAKEAPTKPKPTLDCNTQPVLWRLMGWGEHKAKFASQITPTAQQLIRSKASQLNLSQADLLEYLSRCLDDPAVEEVIVRQI